MNQTRLDRIEASSPEEERELRAVVALLRSLPDPEPPDDLGARVMVEVRRRESGPRVLRVAFRRFEPLVAGVVAAGVGALVLSTAMQSGLLSHSQGEPAAEPTALQPFAARRVADASPPAAAPARPRIDPLYVALPGADLHAAHLRRMPPPSPLAGGNFDPRPSITDPLDRRLDRDLNSLLLDPPAFYARVQQMSQPEQYVERLVDRANRRGDAAQIAVRLFVRTPRHPSTSALVDRLLRASRVEDPTH